MPAEKASRRKEVAFGKNAVAALNACYGKGKVFSAAHGLGARSWHMKRQKLSARPTTMRVELMTVR